MTPPDSKILDNSWCCNIPFEDGFWMRVASCGPEFVVRLAWWEGFTQNGKGFWKLAEATECFVRFSSQ